jgi:RNA polymerase sigma-70 factor (ECF subfamily)
MAADVRLHRMRLIASTADASEAASDMELARALIDGAANAAEMAWERYAPLVHRIVSRAIGPDAEVEDVTQEIFYRLFSRIGTLRKPEALRSFVISFAIRIVKWELRRRRARRWLTLSETGDVPDRAADGDDAERPLTRLRRAVQLLFASHARTPVAGPPPRRGMNAGRDPEAMDALARTVKRACARPRRACHR